MKPASRCLLSWLLSIIIRITLHSQWITMMVECVSFPFNSARSDYTWIRTTDFLFLVAWPASLYRGQFWRSIIYAETSRAVNWTYDFLEVCATGASNILLAVSQELSALAGRPNSAAEKTAFPQFVKLPPELRCHIWRHTFSESRVVELRDAPGHMGRLAAQRYVVPWISPAALPIALGVCQESRKEALRSYELSFSRGGFPPQIYINFDRDVVYFGHKTRAYGVLDMDGFTKGFDKIQHLAIGFSGMSRLVDWQIDKLSSLQDIVMVRSMTPGRHFNPGRCPRLIEFEQGDGEEGEFKMDVTRAVAMYVKRLDERQQEFPDWEVPHVKVGMLVKTDSSRRYQ
jgi:hypothetical protein